MPQEQLFLVIFPDTGSNKGRMAGTTVTTSGKDDGQGGSDTPAMVVEGNEVGAGSFESNEPRSYVLGWKHICVDTQLEKEKKRVE